MILEVDAGNTRIKWRLIQQLDDQWVKKSAGSILARVSESLLYDEIALEFNKLPIESVSRVKVSSVRGEEFDLFFSSLMHERWGLVPEFAVVEAFCAGVNNGYAKPDAMGVDRWLAVLAAYSKAGGACCVVDCGSAITVDFVNSKGVHEGGYIVPGFSTMRDALSNKSQALKFADAQWDSVGFGNGTGQAISNGLMNMVVGMLEKVCRDQGDDKEQVSWFLTGGDASLVAPFIGWQFEMLDDLVLDGLSIVMVE